MGRRRATRCRPHKLEKQTKLEAETRTRDNRQQSERLAETTRHCGESETRVQFLIDRIVALLSTQLQDPAQTEAVVVMRSRERELLRLLEGQRGQCDEVKQQSQELNSCLDEELGLSRRLKDQPREVIPILQ